MRARIGWRARRYAAFTGGQWRIIRGGKRNGVRRVKGRQADTPLIGGGEERSARVYTREGPLDAHGMLLQHAAPLSYLEFARLLVSNRTARICASEAAPPPGDTYITLHCRSVSFHRLDRVSPLNFRRSGLGKGRQNGFEIVVFQWWKFFILL